jgi:hypothetical protein
VWQSLFPHREGGRANFNSFTTRFNIVKRAIIEDFLKQLLQADLKNLENIIGSYRSSFSTDKFVEIVAGFMCERCDNLLANIESEDDFLRTLALADRCHRLFLKAHARARGVEAGACSLEKAEELNEETVAELRKLLSTGEYKLLIVPKDGYLFFKRYYPSEYDSRKFRYTIELLEKLLKIMKNDRDINMVYDKEIKEIDSTFRELRSRGCIPMDEFLREKPELKLEVSIWNKEKGWPMVRIKVDVGRYAREEVCVLYLYPEERKVHASWRDGRRTELALGRELERELAEHLPKHVKGVSIEESVKLILETLEEASESAAR